MKWCESENESENTIFITAGEKGNSHTGNSYHSYMVKNLLVGVEQGSESLFNFTEQFLLSPCEVWHFAQSPLHIWRFSLLNQFFAGFDILQDVMVMHLTSFFSADIVLKSILQLLDFIERAYGIHGVARLIELKRAIYFPIKNSASLLHMTFQVKVHS